MVKTLNRGRGSGANRGTAAWAALGPTFAEALEADDEFEGGDAGSGGKVALADGFGDLMDEWMARSELVDCA